MNGLYVFLQFFHLHYYNLKVYIDLVLLIRFQKLFPTPFFNHA